MPVHRSLFVVAVLAAAVIGVKQPATAIGPVRIESFEKAFWNDRIVIIATVDALTPPDEPSKPSLLRLEPMATLTGDFDAGRVGEIEADFYCDTLGVITKAPPLGAPVLVLLKVREAKEVRGGAPYLVEPGLCRFMPGSLSLVEITGPADQRVEEVARAIRKLRAEAEARALLRPSNRPRQTPDKDRTRE